MSASKKVAYRFAVIRQRIRAGAFIVCLMWLGLLFGGFGFLVLSACGAVVADAIQGGF